MTRLSFSLTHKYTLTLRIRSLCLSHYAHILLQKFGA